ncbi:hypothetical protein [Rhizobium leguminosarum]|uniref:hypothetical protein n=1 Tax=Rhizobium leguminosarum TaxID=384 RepID=UPI003F9C41EB
MVVRLAKNARQHGLADHTSFSVRFDLHCECEPHWEGISLLSNKEFDPRFAGPAYLIEIGQASQADGLSKGIVSERLEGHDIGVAAVSNEMERLIGG